MKLKFVILLAVFAGALASCKKDHIKGSGSIKTEQRNVSGFTRIVVEGATDVHITAGADFKVEVKAYSNLLPHFQTRLENGTLILKYSNDVNPRNDNSEVFITMPALNGVSTSGSGDVDAKGDFADAQTFDASISGSSNISIENASAQKLVLSISGSGDFKSFGFESDEADISISGSGDAEITVNEKLKAKIRGSGNVYYKGNPATIEDDISGSGEVIKK
ncbi:MAG: head GIN domain-containing protein [Agriterribacter sp.]